MAQRDLAAADLWSIRFDGMKEFARYVLGAVLLVVGGTAWAALPPGNYRKSCSAVTVGADDVLKARCRTKGGATVDTSLKLPCNGSIDNLNGKLTC
jgi:hypothetical protein